MTSLVGSCADEPAADAPAPTYTRPSYADVDAKGHETAIHFTDITESSGIDFSHENGAFGQKWMPETMGSGGGFFDFDGDGWQDLFLVNGSQWPGHRKSQALKTSRLYRNMGGDRFTDVTAAAGLDINLYGMGCAFADYDDDGDLDIYVTAVGSNRLLRNDSGKFTDVTEQAGVHGNGDGENEAWSTSAVWLDFDRDGRLDLFVCNYVKWTPETDIFTTLDGTNKSYATPEQYQGESCRLYRNLDGKRFQDVTEDTGVYNPDGKSLGVAVADFNQDSWPDLFVANDTQPNFLYLNKGNGVFEDIALRAGVAFDEIGRARAGMGIDIADIANNGELAIVIGNFSREPLSLYTQIGLDLFQDQAGKARLTRPSLLQVTFGLQFVDMDLDGFLDLVAANGHIDPNINAVQQEVTFAQRPQLFRNNRKGEFLDVSDQVGESFSVPVVARGIATADIDLDGDLDLLLTVNAGPPKLLRNDLAAFDANWIKLQLRGRSPNRNAVGAKVRLWSGGIRQQCLVRTGSSYLSQSDFTTLTFGLGAQTKVDSLEVQWPTTGKLLKLGSAAVGRTYIIDENSSELQPREASWPATPAR